VEGHQDGKRVKACDLREAVERATFAKSYKGKAERGSSCCRLPTPLEYGGDLRNAQ